MANGNSGRDWFKWSTGFFAGLSILLLGGAMADWRNDVGMDRVLRVVEKNETTLANRDAEITRALDSVAQGKDQLQAHVISMHPLTEVRLSQILFRMEKLETNQEKMLGTQRDIVLRLGKKGM